MASLPCGGRLHLCAIKAHSDACCVCSFAPRRALSQLLKSFFLLRPLEGVRAHHHLESGPGAPSWKVGPILQTLQKCDTRVIVITGPPCSGKTSSMAELMQRLQGEGVVSACHYCRQFDSRTLNTVSMMRTLAFGLALQHPELQVWATG